MKKKILNYTQYLLFMGAGLFLIWWQFRDFQPNEKKEFFNAIGNVNFWYMIPVVCMSIASHICRSMRWKLLLNPLGFNPSLANTFGVTMVGYLANSAVPRLGELLKCTMLAKYEKLKVDKLIGTIILERSFDMVCYLVFICITFLIQMDTIGNYLRNELKLFSKSNGSDLIINLSLLLLMIAAFFILLRFLLSKFPHNKIIQNIHRIVQGVLDGVKAIRSLTSVRLFLIQTIFIWLMYLGQIYLGFKAMEGTHLLGVPAACSVLTLATLAMIVTPGGLGSFPIFVMQTLSLYGIETVQGKAFGWIMWGASTSIVIVLGFVSLFLLPYINRANRKIQ